MSINADGSIGISFGFTNNDITGISKMRTSASRSNTSAPSTSRSLLEAAISDARSQASAAVDSSRSGVQAILGRQGDVDSAILSMRGAADNMLPIAGDLRNQGNAMFESGTKVTEQALETLGTGLGFIRMDSSASPLVAEAMRLYGEFDPDKYVATAAQDVQSQGDNARAQGMRNLSRMGVSPTSGASQALNQLYDRSLAVARTAAMTRARERGKTDQAAQFQNLVANNANTFLKTGGELASIGSSMQSQGTGALKNAASVLGDAGSLYGSAGTLSLNFGNALSGAWGALAKALLNQAANTTDSERLRVSALTSGGGGRFGGGVNVTNASEDDWMNWKGTGHSEGWNRNNNPNYQTLLDNGR